MTKRHWIRKRQTAIFAFFLLFSFFLLANIGAISEAVRAGMRFSFHVIIPTLFPFLILSSLLTDTAPRSNKQTSPLFTRLFRLPNAAMLPLFLGLLTGFPVGASTVAELYQNGSLKKEEAERLLLFANNTGPAFLFGGIGALFEDRRLSLLLFTVQLVTALLFGLFSALGKAYPEKASMELCEKNPLSLVDSVVKATEATLHITGFILLFYVLLTAFEILCPNPYVLTLFSLVLEVGNATRCVAALSLCPLFLQASFLAFSLSFSGLSVYFQTRAVLKKSGLSLRFYLPAKLLQGLLAATIALLLGRILL